MTGSQGLSVSVQAAKVYVCCSVPSEHLAAVGKMADT